MSTASLIELFIVQVMSYFIILSTSCCKSSSAFVSYSNSGASILGGRDPQILGWGGRGGSQGGSWTGFGKHYSVFCTESMLENVFL